MYASLDLRSVCIALFLQVLELIDCRLVHHYYLDDTQQRILSLMTMAFWTGMLMFTQLLSETVVLHWASNSRALMSSDNRAIALIEAGTFSVVLPHCSDGLWSIVGSHESQVLPHVLDFVLTLRGP